MKWLGVAILMCFVPGAMVNAVTTPPALEVDGDTLWLMDFQDLDEERWLDATGHLEAEAHGTYRHVATERGHALGLNGIDGYVQLLGDASDTFAGDASFTLEARLKVFKEGATQQIFTGPPLCELEVRGESGAVSFNLRSADGTSVRCTGQTPLTDGKWHHVAAVRDAAAGTLRLYIDGLLDAEVQDATRGQTVFVPRSAMIGSNAGGSEALGGIIDAVRLSRGARTFEPTAYADADDVDHHVLENDHVRFTFATRGPRLALSSLVDKSSGVEFIEADLPPDMVNHLWHINLRSEAWSSVIDEHGSNLSVEPGRTAEGNRLTFRWAGLSLDDGSQATVVATVTLPDDDALADWRIEVDHTSDEYGVWTIRFPRINNLRRLTSEQHVDHLVIPGGNGGGAGEGHLFTDPFQTLTHPFVRTYPCYHQSMQFNAYYSDGSGLYLATHDGDMHLKGFLLKPAPATGGLPDVLRYELHHYPTNSGVEGVGFEQSYPALVGVFDGDWYDAAQIYRAWALDQVWAQKGPTHQRDDISPWIKEGAFWMSYQLEAYLDGPLLRREARTLPVDELRRRGRQINVDEALTTVREAKDYFGYPLVLWCNSWFEGGGDTSPPRYVPMRGVAELMDRLHDDFEHVYFSAHIQPQRYSVQVREYDEQVEQSLEHLPDGSLHIGPVMPGETDDQHAYPCWATDFWQSFWRDKATALAELDIDGFHVDELGSATSFNVQCFNRSHGHAVGGGPLYATHHRAMTTTLRDGARAVQPDFAIHHEVLNEIYIDVADAAEVCTTPSNSNIPLYEAVYHDYNLIMGRRIMAWNDRNMFPPGKEDPDEHMDELVSSFAQTYVWGNQPGWIRTDIVSYHPRGAAFIKRLMDARYQTMKFLNFGRMMRPLTEVEPWPRVNRTWRYCDTPEHVLPVVMNSVWQAADGHVGIVMVNITDEPQEVAYQLDLAECGIEGEYTLRRVDGPTSQALGSGRDAVLEQRVSLEGYDVMIVEIAPVEERRAHAK